MKFGNISEYESVAKLEMFDEKKQRPKIS
jgi:hypothetical protein